MSIINGTAGNDTLNGTTGDDSIDGMAGADRMTGLAGNDTYVVDNTGDVVVEASAAGTDLILSGVVYTLPSNVENLTLTGSGFINATGNTLNNTLTGNSGNNILNGGTGTDILIGGLGDDTYVVDSTTDTLTEAVASGTDLVQSGVSFSLAAIANVENLTLTGTGNNSATGNALNNLLTGNSGSNTLNGGDGVDTLAGGTGNDIYVVDSTTDTITEAAAAGTDTVQSSVSFSLAAIDNVEKLTLTGTSHNFATGNTLANTLTGNTGNNLLDGGSGSDTMSGGTGNDTYVVDSTTDVISEAASAGTDLIQSSVTFTASGNVENLTLTGAANINATGNTLNNILTGNSGNNLLNGSSGIDTLIGGLGNDTYGVDSVTDILTEAADAGTDLVQASVSFSLAAIANIENLTLTGTGGYTATGNSLDNVLTGNSGSNTLNGGAGMDTLAGGTGNDTYVVDSITDIITEAAAAGTDLVQSSVSFSLASIANVENLTLTGTGNTTATGNTLNNTLTGNTGNNLLDGGSGTDTLVGGTGDDTYLVDSTTDVVTEGATAGTDLIQSSVTFTASSNVERLTLTGSANINATGNTLNNVLTGNSGNNLLNGSSGIDTLIGGLGNDTYVVDSTTDILTEAADAGTDLVQSSVTFSLAAIANIENLTLTGTGNINATGNSLSNALVGTSGNNLLDGGAGVDSFSGGAGNDTYVVDDAADAITEAAASGTDLVRASSSYSLAAIANVENLTLTGTGHTTATGNTLNNTLTGNTGNNILNGGAGTDILIGGTGDDTYVVDSTTDTLTEAAGAGTDTVQSSVTFTLAAMANIENVTLTGAANINAIGNTGDNVLSGNAGINTLNGGNGNDTLNGGGGNDILTGGAGTDTAVYALNWSQYAVSTVTGVTTVTALSGTEGSDTLTGMETLVFNGVSVSIANALNDGPVGVSDSNGGDAVVEAHAHAAGDAVAVGNVLGNDTDADLLLGMDEQLTVSSVNGISGNVGVTVTGIYGQLLLAQDGSYTYTLNNADADTEALVTGQTVLDVFNYGVVDAHGASGSAVLSISIDGRTDNRAPVADGGSVSGTEDGVISGAATASDADGHPLTFAVAGATPEGLTFNSGGSFSFAPSVADQSLDSGESRVVSFDYVANDGAVDSAAATVTVTINGVNDAPVASGASVSVTEDDSGITGSVNAGDADGEALSYSLVGAAPSGLTFNSDGSFSFVPSVADQSLDSGESRVVSFDYVANDGTVDSAAATVTVTINGVNDAPVLAEPDAINLTDTVQNDSFAPVDGLLIASDAEGGSLVYGISGGVDLGAGLVQLDGIHGSLTVNSLTGSYRFLADANSINALVSDATETFTVTVSDGDASDSRLLSIHIAQDGVTESLGNDVFSGTAGADHFEGLAGDDTYVIGALDTIAEAFGEGTDTVVIASDYTLGANLENLVLTGRALLAGGNELDNGLTGNAGNNTLSGGAGNDRLDGGLGTDMLVGGTGNDTYVVDALDKITELAGEGVDTVEASVSWTLGNHLENLLLTGTAHVMATGNTLDNVITGNSGFNILSGGLGNDWLSGEAGNDTLNGDDGQDTLVGGQGNDILSGGLGSDTYQIQRGQGTDTITDVEASANTDVLWFNDATISSDQLWFRQTGADLEVAVIGTTTKALVKNWFGGAANQIEEIRAGDGLVLLNTEVQNLVSAMAAFSTRPAGSASLTVPEQAALTGVLAANWS